MVHVRLRVKDDVSSLRNIGTATELRGAFAGGCAKPGFSLCQFSIQRTHVHLVCEADNHVALGRGMQGLGVRAAKAINRAHGRKGSVFAERYRVTRVKTPTQMRNTLCYVLHNARRHGSRIHGVDMYSSARYFDGFSKPHELPPPQDPSIVPVAKAKTHLLKKRWRWIGLIDVDETPTGA